MRFAAWADSAMIFPWPSLSVHRYPWGWAVQLCWIAWGVDASYDYRKEQFSGGGNKP
jgi:hypothetical protein